ncbi:hypothetical protein HPT25_05555 [Bacillus sp. BRMEA1]|nr:kinase [Neobacillus endophyticus]NRD76959.1 hypothetical protein [Neobacillus endophyticus]
MNNNILSIFTQIPKVEIGHRVVLGIDGLSRSGKTTFVKEIGKLLETKEIPVCIFHIDDYIVERKRRYNTRFDEWYEYYYLQWDVRYLTDSLFKKLKIDSEMHLLKYDPDSDAQYEQVVELPVTCLIIVEGVFLQRKEWRPYYDFMIYLDCSREKRFQRESEATQNHLEKFENRYWKAEDYYMDTELPMTRADVIMNND